MSVKKIIDPDALVLHVGCGLDSRCNRVEHECTLSAILILEGISMYLKTEHSFTPDHLVDELNTSERRIFRFLFTGRAYGKIYRLYELDQLVKMNG